jgi:hypothetical protein
MPTTNKTTNVSDHLLSTLRLFAMSDSDQGEKKAGVPSWQLKSKDETAKEEEKSSAESTSRETIIEQAKKFLEEDEVRNASTDKKIAFLESKGLRSEEIQDLLGITMNPEASSEVAPPFPSKHHRTKPSRLHDHNLPNNPRHLHLHPHSNKPPPNRQ